MEPIWPSLMDLAVLRASGFLSWLLGRCLTKKSGTIYYRSGTTEEMDCRWCLPKSNTPWWQNSGNHGCQYWNWKRNRPRFSSKRLSLHLTLIPHYIVIYLCSICVCVCLICGFATMYVYTWLLGARVVMACRDMRRGEKAASEVRRTTGNGNVVVRELDLSSLKSVREFVSKLSATEDRLDILINNAGEMHSIVKPQPATDLWRVVVMLFLNPPNVLWAQCWL